MKTLTARFLTLFGIALLATVMAFSLASCKHDSGDDDLPKIPAELQDTRWSNSAGEEITFDKVSVTIKPVGEQAQTFFLKGTSYESAISQTILFFKDKNSPDDTITYRDGKITMVNFSIIKNKTDPINGWKKDDNYNVYGDFVYSYDSSSVTITDYIGGGSYIGGGYSHNITIPSSINGKPVTTIADGKYHEGGIYNYSGVFAEKNLTSVTIPDSVTSIGIGAFALNDLTSVTIPGSVTSIGNGAFAWNKLTSITIPGSVTSIGDHAFVYNKLTTVTISNGVKTIGDGAFRYTDDLTSITIGANVELSTNNSSFDTGNSTHPIFDTAYNTGGKVAGTYTRSSNTQPWTKQP